MIDDLPTVAEVIERITQQARDTLKQLGSM
jgi:hypothetical protein